MCTKSHACSLLPNVVRWMPSSLPATSLCIVSLSYPATRHLVSPGRRLERVVPLLVCFFVFRVDGQRELQPLSSCLETSINQPVYIGLYGNAFFWNERHPTCGWPRQTTAKCGMQVQAQVIGIYAGCTGIHRERGRWRRVVVLCFLWIFCTVSVCSFSRRLVL